MSRIHDALKKAEAEKTSGEWSRNGVAVEDDHASPAVADHAEPTRSDAKSIATIVSPDPEVTDAAFLRRLLVERCDQHQWSPAPDSTVNFDKAADIPGSEEFRTLRSRLNLVRERQILKKLLITSALPQEGKSFLSLNLAQTLFRQTERHVLLIDGDLRSPSLHVSLGAALGPGLSDYLSGGLDEFEVVQRGPRDNFFFIPAGESVAHASELLGNGRLKSLLERLAPAFDWIIIDSPPIIPISDAKVVGEACDGVLMVVKAGSTPFDLAKKACAEFRGKAFLGVVLNRADTSATYGYHYYQGKEIEKAKNGRKK